MVKKEETLVGEVMEGVKTVKGKKGDDSEKMVDKDKASSFDKWLEQYNANYYGKSKEAKDLEPFLKKNYKGNPYLPWATLERMLYQQDPEAIIEKAEDVDLLLLNRHSIDSQKQGVMEHNESIAPMVHVSVRFLNKWFEEFYPIQDNNYVAVRFADSNAINKALQRAVTRCISRATGLGLSLYENGDLQFENDLDIPTTSKEIKPAPVKQQAVQPPAPELKANISKAGVPIPEPKEEQAQPVSNNNGSVLNEIVLKLRNGESDLVMNCLQKINSVLVTRIGKVIDIDKDDDATILDKLSCVAKPENLLTMLERQGL